MSKIDIENQQVFANDDVAEPFQPAPTWERWRQQELWQNREGTVVRTGLYLKDRKEIADNFAEGDKNLEDVKKGYQDADAILEGLIDDTQLVAQQAAQDATNALNKVLEVDSGYKAADDAIVKTVNENKAASDTAEKALNDRIDDLILEKSILINADVSPGNSGVTFSNEGVKCEALVNASEKEIYSVEIYMHNLKATISADIGNSLPFTISVTLPDGSAIADSRKPLLGVSDTGGLTYSTGFSNYKTNIVSVNESAGMLTIKGSFYSSANFPNPFTDYNFRDVIVKVV